MRVFRPGLFLVTIGVTAVTLLLVVRPFRAATHDDVRLIMLGTGAPIPDPKAFGPATAIVIGSRIFLVDAGPGVTRQLAAAGFPRIKDVEATFLTHLHSDHTLGYPDLVFTTWIMGRRSPLVVFGPSGLKRMTARLMDAWREDIDVRISGLERESREWLAVDVREIGPGTIYAKDGVRVTAFPVRHAEWKHAFGYRFDVPGRSITISGDAAPSEALVVAARGTDVLVHEVYIEGRLKPEDRPGGDRWPEVHALRAYVERRTWPPGVAHRTWPSRAAPCTAHGRHRRGAACRHSRRGIHRPRGHRERSGRFLRRPL